MNNVLSIDLSDSPDGEILWPEFWRMKKSELLYLFTSTIIKPMGKLRTWLSSPYSKDETATFHGILIVDTICSTIGQSIWSEFSESRKIGLALHYSSTIRGSMDKRGPWMDSAHSKGQIIILHDVLIVGLSDSADGETPVTGILVPEMSELFLLLSPQSQRLWTNGRHA